MPSAHQPVEIPPELDGRYRHVELEVVPDGNPSFWRSLIGLLMVVAGTSALGVGVGLWVHPGAGLAAAGVVVVVVGVLLGMTD